MQIDVVCDDKYGGEAYAKLFENIIGDIGKSFMISKAKLVLKPEVPLFVFSVILKNEPGCKVMSEAASFRQEGEELYVSISNERYAPDVLSNLWKVYGRPNVDQQTRFDLVVRGAKQEDVEDMVISTGEEAVEEILGAFWRALPEGIRVRDAMIEGKVITVIATEEIMRQELKDQGIEVHKGMVIEGEAIQDV